MIEYATLLSRSPTSSIASASHSPERLWKAFAFECIERLSETCMGKDARRLAPKSSVDKAVSFIFAHADRPVHAGEIAKAAGLSERQLRRLFKSQFGATVADVVADVRIQRAKNLLGMRFSVCEVARMMGESSQAQLCRIFKRRLGISPKQYQNRHSPRISPCVRTRHRREDVR